MTTLNYNYTTYDDFATLATKQPELSRRLVKEYGKEGNWMHNPLTVYKTVRDYAIKECERTPEFIRVVNHIFFF